MTKQKIYDLLVRFEENPDYKLIRKIKEELVADIEKEIAKKEGKVTRFRHIKKFYSYFKRDNLFVEKPEEGELFGYTNGKAAFLLKDNFDFTLQLKKAGRNSEETAMPLASIHRVMPKEQTAFVEIDLELLRKEIVAKNEICFVKVPKELKECGYVGAHTGMLYTLLSMFNETKVGLSGVNGNIAFSVFKDVEKGVLMNYSADTENKFNFVTKES